MRSFSLNYFYLLILSLLSFQIQAQSICTDAADISNGCAAGNLTGAGIDGGALIENYLSCGNGNTIAACGANAGFTGSSYTRTDHTDLWFAATPNGSNELTVTISNLSGGNIMILPYLTDGTCPSASSANSLMESHIGNTAQSLTGGDCPYFASNGSITFQGTALATATTVYLRVMAYAPNGSGATNCETLTYASFDICTSIPQANDICANAINITTNNLDNPGTASTGDYSSSNDEGNSIDCTGTAATEGDLWYEITYPTVASVIQDFFTELSLSGTAGETVRVLVYDVTSACGSAGTIGDVDHCEEIIFTGGNDVTTLGNIATSDGFSRYVQIVPVGNVGNVTAAAIVVNENNSCSHFQNSLPGYDITSAQPANFNYASDSGANPAMAGNDLWFQFSPLSGNDGFHSINSTSANITVSGLNTGNGEEISILLYKGNGISADNCMDLAGDYLSSTTISNNNTFSQAISCLDEWHGSTDGGYLIRIVQTAGSSTASPTITITPNAPGPSNNSCANIWDGSGPATGPTNNPNSDAAHDWNQFWIKNGETVPGSFVGANDCGLSGVCNSTDYEAIQEINDRDLWYVFDVPDNECAISGLTQSTVLYSMDITYDANNAFRDGILYIYSDCGNLVDCSGALDGAGTTWTANGLTQGNSYLLRVKPWDISSTPTDWAFDITINESNPAPCNDNPANAEGLAIGNCVNYSTIPTWSAQGATASSPVSGSPESDVWFSFDAPVTNGGAYPTVKSWVTVMMEAVSGEALWLELYTTMSSEGGSLMTYTASGAGDQVFAQFGNLVPGKTYYLRLYHKEQATTDVEYKINVSTGTGGEPGWNCGENSYSNISGCSSPCGDLREEWFKIDLPDGTPDDQYWMIEVFGHDEWLDFELRSKYLSGSAPFINCNGSEDSGEGNCADFDHPCSSSPLEASVSISSTTILNSSGELVGAGTNASCDNGSTPGIAGKGVRRVYFGMNGTLPDKKDYYYLRVFLDPASPNYATAKDINICQLNFYGSYLSVSDANTANGSTTPCPDSNLPVELITFDAIETEKNNLLIWATASEENTSEFIIERSANGADRFEEIGSVKAEGFSASYLEYSATDDNPVSVSYYRLKIVDFDGSFEYSETVLVKRNSRELAFINLSPNPSKGLFNINFEAPDNSGLTFTITDISGKTIENRYHISNENESVSFNLAAYHAGVYFVSINDGISVISQKILIVK